MTRLMRQLFALGLFLLAFTSSSAQAQESWSPPPVGTVILFEDEVLWTVTGVEGDVVVTQVLDPHDVEGRGAYLYAVYEDRSWRGFMTLGYASIESDFDFNDDYVITRGNLSKLFPLRRGNSIKYQMKAVDQDGQDFSYYTGEISIGAKTSMEIDNGVYEVWPITDSYIEYFYEDDEVIESSVLQLWSPELGLTLAWENYSNGELIFSARALRVHLPD